MSLLCHRHLMLLLLLLQLCQHFHKTDKTARKQHYKMANSLYSSLYTVLLVPSFIVGNCITKQERPQSGGDWEHTGYSNRASDALRMENLPEIQAYQKFSMNTEGTPGGKCKQYGRNLKGLWKNQDKGSQVWWDINWLPILKWSTTVAASSNKRCFSVMEVLAPERTPPQPGATVQLSAWQQPKA